jgi:hypothetical protein
MRKIVALVLTGVFALSMAAVAKAGEETQKEEFTISPTKLSPKKPSNIQFVNTITTPDNATLGQPPSATRTILDLPKQFKINNDKVATCKTDAAGLESAATVEDAKAACGSASQVSSDAGSTAVVRTNLGAPFDVIDVQVVAFNEDGDQLLLYSKPTGSNDFVPASILVGKLKKTGAIKDVQRPAGPYKQSLDVAIPQLAAGAIAFFEVTIPKSKYIQAKCKPKTIKAQATTLFSNGGGPDASQPQQSSDDHSVKCKAKKK